MGDCHELSNVARPYLIVTSQSVLPHKPHCLNPFSLGLQPLTLPSHTTHGLQPLDATIFKSFEATLENMGDFGLRGTNSKG